ncbi:hypothetical protein EYY67_01565 [Rahnella victoriana]|nr:hypothetical protein A9993_22085 [Rahnella victoriana]TBX37468.1 hypothetical protein EYY67_01565 [Rahnella victoriana]
MIRYSEDLHILLAKPDTYVFFQHLKEHGGGYWLGQVYDDWFGFVIEEPVSLRRGMEYLIVTRGNQEGIMEFDDSLDNFMLKG